MLKRLEAEAKEREQTISGFCRFLFNEYFKAKEASMTQSKFSPYDRPREAESETHGGSIALSSETTPPYRTTGRNKPKP